MPCHIILKESKEKYTLGSETFMSINFREIEDNKKDIGHFKKVL